MSHSTETAHSNAAHTLHAVPATATSQTATAPRRRRARAAAVIAGSIAAALMLSGCAPGSGSSSNTTAKTGTLNVVTTTTQLTDFVHEIGGDDVKLTGLLPVGASAHHFDPTAADLLALGEADVLVVNGFGLETFVDSAVTASGFHGVTITAADGIDEAEARAITARVDAQAHASENAQSTPHNTTEGDHDHEEGDHDHGDVNPHIWTAPTQAAHMVTEIADGLAAADSAHAAVYRERATAYNEKLAALDTWISEQFARVPEKERVLVSGHNALAYYLDAYNITFAGSILPSFEDNAEPSAAAIDTLVADIKQHGVRAIFVESSMSPKLAATIAKEAGVKVIDAETLYTDALGAEGSNADTYIGATIHNTRVIMEAWGETPTELPAELRQ